VQLCLGHWAEAAQGADAALQRWAAETTELQPAWLTQARMRRAVARAHLRQLEDAAADLVEAIEGMPAPPAAEQSASASTLKHLTVQRAQLQADLDQILTVQAEASRAS